MNSTLNLTPAAVVIAVVVALLASAFSVPPLRRMGGGRATAVQRHVPGAIYFADVLPVHKRRRLLLDISTVSATVAASAVFAWAFIPFAFMFAAVASACHTDLRTKRLPHRLTMTNWAASVVFALLASPSSSAALTAIGLGLGVGVALFALGVATNGRLFGMGDVYLSLGTTTMVAVFGGVAGLVASFVAMSFVSLFVLVGLLVRHRGRLPRRTHVPFGPHIALGALIALAVAVVATYADPAPLTPWAEIAQRLTI